MNYENVMNDCKHLVEKWDNYGMMKNIDDVYQKHAVAVVLENQRLYNETCDDDRILQRFRRLSIPVARWMIANNPINDLVGVQPMFGPTITLATKSYCGKFDEHTVSSYTSG